MHRPPNARFWVWHKDAWVRITLRPGQTLEAHVFVRTPEGWVSEFSTWTHRGRYVFWESAINGRNRRGNYVRNVCYYCLLNSLEGRDMFSEMGVAENVGISAPDWMVERDWHQLELSQIGGCRVKARS